MKVLVVEDPSAQQGSLSADLQKFGYSVDVVNDSDRATEFAESRGYEVIILDLMLPGESNLLLLHEIRESNRDVKILLLSEHDQVHDRVTALIQGANDYLVKPFSFDELNACMQKLLRRENSQDSASEASGSEHDASEYTNRLIAELLDRCTCDHGPIELVISEIKASALLQRVCTELKKPAKQSGIRIKLPTGNMPTLLSDDQLMQHLVVKLLSCAISRCPAGREIELNLSLYNDHCTISIVTPLARPMTSSELKRIFRNLRRDESEAADESVANLSLARNYAERLNLDLKAFVVPNNRFSIELSKIRVI